VLARVDPVEVSAPPAALRDVDTPEALAALRSERGVNAERGTNTERTNAD